MTNRDEEIIRILSNAVRALSLEQVARTWWTNSRWGRSRAKKTLEELSIEDLLHVRRVLSRPILERSEPIATWQLDAEVPDFKSLVTHLHLRAATPAKMLTIAFASHKSIALFSRRRMTTIKLTQMTHDLHVSEVFLHYRKQGLASAWLSEDQLPVEWPIRERPDAVLLGKNQTIVHAIEYGGDYPVERLQELHHGLASAGLSYEIW